MILPRFPRLALGLALFLSAIPARSTLYALDLSPIALPGQLGEMDRGRYYFRDGEKRIGFRVDANTTVREDNGSTTFRFSDADQCAAAIAHSAIQPALAGNSSKPAPAATFGMSGPFDVSQVDRYRQAAVASLPAGATDVAVEKEEKDPVAINGWSSYLFILKYSFYGKSFRQGALFLNYNPTEQLLISISTPPEQFESVFERMFRVLNTFYEMGSDADSPNRPT